MKPTTKTLTVCLAFVFALAVLCGPAAPAAPPALNLGCPLN